MVKQRWKQLLPSLLLLLSLATAQETCPALDRNGATVEPDADVTVGAVLELHEPGRGVFGCGPPSPEGVHYYEALRWALDALNKNRGSVGGVEVTDSFVPGIKLGLRVYDTCGHKELSLRYMTELYPVMKTGSLTCDGPQENSSSIIGMVDMTSSLNERRVADAASRYIIPIIPLRQETAVPPEQLAKVLAEVVHDMDWERVAILHADDEYSIFVAKTFSQIAKSGHPCISAIKSLPLGLMTKDKAQEARTFHRMLTSFASRLPDKTGVIVIGHDKAYEAIAQAFKGAQDNVSRLQWLFSWIPSSSSLSNFSAFASGKQIFSLAPYPREIEAFQDYWARLGDLASPYDPNDRFFLEHVMSSKGCRMAGFKYGGYEDLGVCENLVVKEDQAEVMLRTARFMPAVHSLYTFAHAYRKAWAEKCLQIPGSCSDLLRMTRREFVERYLEPLEFSHDPRDRSPPGVQGQKTAQGASGEMEGVRLALNAYVASQGQGLSFKQVLSYDSHEAKVLDKSFRYIPSTCPKGGCKDCISVRQARLEDPYIGMPSNEDKTTLSSSSSTPLDEIKIPLLIPIHKAGASPLDCGHDLNDQAVQDLEAALWTIDQINRDTEFLPGIRLGAVAIDTCASPLMATQKLSNFLLDTRKSGLDDILSDLAFVATGGREEFLAISRLTAPLNVSTVSVADSIRPKDMAPHHLQVAVPLEKKTKAVAETLKHLGWSYVTVLSDQSDHSKTSAELFRGLATESDLCLATELVAPPSLADVEMDSLMMAVVAAQRKGSRVVVMWATEPTTAAFLRAVHRAVAAGVVRRGELAIVASGEWIVNLQSFKEFENEATGVIVLKDQQGEVEDFAVHYQRLLPEENRRNPWFQQLWEQKQECRGDQCEDDATVHYTASSTTVNMIQGLLAISAGLARLRNDLCHQEPGLCPALLQARGLRELLHRSVRETASSRLDAKGEMFSFTRQGYGNLPVEIFNFRRAAGRNFVYQKVGTYQNHLSELADIVMYDSDGDEISVERMRSECGSDCGATCDKRATDFVILDSRDQLYLAASVDVHQRSSVPLTCSDDVSAAGMQTLEAFLWALDQVNASPQLLPGVTLGAVVFDTCSSREKAARDVANFFSSSMHSAAAANGQQRKIPAVQQILGLLATQADDVIGPILDVAMPFDMVTLAPRVSWTNFNDLSKYPKLLRASLPNDVRAGALVDLLTHFKWGYVSVVYSETPWREADLFESFSQRAQVREIRLAMAERVPQSFSDAAMTIVLSKLQAKRQEGARVVVLLLDSNHTSRILAAVQHQQDTGKMDYGDFVWVTHDNVDAFHKYPLVSLGSLMVQPSRSTVFPFKQYFEALSPKNNSRNPWFREFWEQAFQCKGAACEAKLPAAAFLQDPGVPAVVNSVLSLAVGMEAMRQQLCPGVGHGLCAAMAEDPRLRDMLFNATRDSSFTGADGRLFQFTGQQFSAGLLDVLNFRQVGNNAHAFVNVGHYSPDEGLSLNFSKIKSYDEYGREISLYDIKSECLLADLCEKGPVENRDVSTMQIASKQNFAISVSMPIRSKGRTFFTCGEIKDGKMFENLAAITYAIDHINKNATLLPGIEIGAVVFDYCDRRQKAEEQLYGFFSRQHEDENASLRIKPKSIVAALTFGKEVAQDAAPIYKSMHVMQIAASTDRTEQISDRNLLQTAPSTMAQIQALVSLLKRFRWRFVNVVYSNTDFGRSGYYEFSKAARQNGVCLANVVLAETGSGRGALLTGLQSGLNKEAAVVVALIDDAEIVAHILEAARNSYILNKFVWLGTETWTNNAAVSLDGSPFDAIVLKLESSRLPDFDRYLEGLTPRSHFPIPDLWFEEFWQRRFQCRLPDSAAVQKQFAPVCQGKERLSALGSQNEHVYHTVKTVQAVAEGLHGYMGRKCPYGMAALGIDDCGGDARYELRKEIQTALYGAPSDCEECGSTGTVFGYEIYQHFTAGNGTKLRVQIGEWKDNLLSVDDAKVRFSSRSTPKSECRGECPGCASQLGAAENFLATAEPLYANFQTVWGIVVTALSILGIVLVLICALYFLMSFPITVGTTVLGYMILFGLLLLYAVNFAFVLSPTEGTCGVRRFGLGLAYAVIFSGMLVKVMNTWRLMGYNGSRILSDGTRLSSPAGLLVIAVGLVIIQIVLSAAWLILMPPKTGAYEQVWRCAPPTTFEEGLVVSLIYVMLLLAITTLFSMLTWQCQDNNRESRWILACAVMVAIVWLAWTILSTQLSPHYRDTTIAAANLVNATIIMMCLYLRKVYLYSKLTRQARDQDLKTHLQPTSYSHSLYGSSQKTFSTLAPILYGSQASLNAKKLYNGPSSRVELINCPEDNKSDSSGSVQVQATDLYPLDMYDGGSQFQPVTSLYGSNHTLVLDDTLTFGR